MSRADLAAPRAWWTLALCFCGALAEGFDIQSMGVAAPGMAPALALSRAQLGPAFSASTIGLLIGALVMGRIADNVGRKWTLIASLATFGVFSAATALAWNLDSLLVIRLLAGLGLGGALPTLSDRIRIHSPAAGSHRPNAPPHEADRAALRRPEAPWPRYTLPPTSGRLTP